MSEIGRYATGELLRLDTSQLHVLVSGLSGSGKSSTLRALLVGASRDPATALVLLDPKRVEFGIWRPRAVVAVDHDAITSTLRQLAELIDARYRILDAAGQNAWTPTPAAPRVLLVVDELAALVAGGDRDRDRDNATALRHVLERGRAAGVTCVASLQRPAAEIIPTAVRDLYQCRILHALADRVSVEMAAGAGWATCRSDTIPIGPRHAGTCYVLLDGERQGRLARSYWCDPDTAAAVARRTSHLRHPWEALRPVEAPSRMASAQDLPPPPHAPADAPSPTGPVFDADEAAVWSAITASGSVPVSVLPSRCGLPEGRARRAAQRLAGRHLLTRSGSSWERGQ